MKRYVALLRGINVSGKNMIAMKELKNKFETLDFSEVVTHLNSGNVVFSTPIDDEAILSNQIELMIKEQFGLNIPVFVVLQEALKELLNQAPDWWGHDNKEIYDNLIFMMPPLSYEAFYDVVGNPKTEYEKVHHYSQVVFWSFVRSDYKKTNWWSGTSKAKISGKITIRTANTVRKIVSM